MVKIIFFDYHGVLDRRSYGGLLQVIAAAVPQSDPAAVQADLEPLGYTYATGATAPNDFWQAVNRNCGQAAEVAGRKYLLHVDPWRETWEIVNELKPRFALGLFSDCSLDKLAAIRRAYDLPEFFDVLVFSCELRKSKQDPEFYQLMTQSGRYKPDECLLIDDQGRNTGLAASLGFQTHIYSSPAELRQYLEPFLEQKDEPAP